MTVLGTLQGCILNSNVGSLAIYNSSHWKKNISGFYVVSFYGNFRNRDWYYIHKMLV